MGSCSLLFREVGMKAQRSCYRFSALLLPVFPSIPVGRKKGLLPCMSQGTCCLIEAGTLQLQIPYKEWCGVSRHVLSLLEVPQAPSWVQALKNPECLRWPVRERCRECSQPVRSQSGDRAKQRLAGQRGKPGWRLASSTGGRQMAGRKQMHCHWARQETRAGRDRERPSLTTRI